MTPREAELARQPRWLDVGPDVDRGPLEAVRLDGAAGAAPTVLLASTCAWTSVAKLAIAFAGTGCRVVCLAPRGHPLAVTQAVTRYLRYRSERPLRSLRQAIALCQPGLIIACDERVVEHLHRLYAETAGDDDDEAIHALIRRSLGQPEHYPMAHSRQGVIDLARRLGVPTPDTRSIRRLQDLRGLAGEQPFPWVLKSDGSWGGLGVRIVQDMAEAERAYDQLSRRIRPLYALRRLMISRDPFWLTPWLHQPPGRVTVQNYVAGRPANCVIAAWGGEALAGFGVEVLASDGETGPASIVQMARDDQMVEAGARLVRALGLSGLVGFDFMIEAKSGRAFLLEMNPRATPICHLRLGPGRDLVAALVARLSGRPAVCARAETSQERIALFPQAELQFSGLPILEGTYSDRPLHEPALTQVMLRRRLRGPNPTLTPVPAL